MNKKHLKSKNLGESSNKQEDVVVEKQSFLSRFFSRELSWYELVLLVVILTSIHYLYSTLSTGMLQGEEGVQYMNMKNFWHEPNSILGNWAKPGWKILYVLPALLGFKFLMLYNSLISALCGLMAYLLAKDRGMKYPLLATILLLSQFLWMELAFRNYSELVTALFLISGIYFQYKEKYVVAALFISYTLIVRQEMIPVVFIYFLYLLYKKKWIAALCLGVFPFLINAWGWYQSGDYLYLLNEALTASATFKDQYPRQGFDHYFRMATPIFGVLTVTGVLAYFGILITRNKKIDYFIFIPAIAFFIFHCIFQLQSHKLGTSTGGNWRYMLVISPLLAVLASIGWNKGHDTKNKIVFIFLLLIYLISAFKHLKFNHNYVLFKPEQGENMLMPIMVAIAVFFFFLPKKKGLLLGGLMVLTFGFNYAYLKPIQIDKNGEDFAVKTFVEGWAKENKMEERPIYAVNQMLNFYWDKNGDEFENGYYTISKEGLDTATIGSYIIWDSHYTKRYTQLDYDYFTTKPNEYKMVHQATVLNTKTKTPATLFLVFEKIGKTEEK